MENAQFSLLNALFGGKAPGGAALTDTTGSDDAPLGQDQKGFFSFLEGLLTANPEGNQETFSAPATQQAPVPFRSLSVHEALAGPDGTAEKYDELALQAPLQDAPVVATPVVADPQTDVLAPQLADVSPAEGLSVAGVQPDVTSHVEETVVVAPQINAVAPPELVTVAAPQLDVTTRPENVSIAGPKAGVGAGPKGATIAGLQSAGPQNDPIVQPLTGEPAAKNNEAQPSHQLTPGAGDAAQGQKAVAGNANLQAVLGGLSNTDGSSSDSTPTVDSELPLEGEVRPDEGESRFAIGVDRSQGKVPGLAGNVNAKAAQAIAEHASPEAIAHSAVTAERGGEGAEFDRLASSRLESTASSAEARNIHVNPVRDQIVAAVVARQGDAKLEIRLDPPELGRVMIGFERDGADIVRAVVTADSPETLDLMRRNADMFQRSLEEQGFAGLDLQFSDTGAGQDASEDAGENSHTFALAEEDAVIAAASAGGSAQLADGRLDRRL